MNPKIAVAVGLAAILSTMLVSTSFAPAFAATVPATITSGATSKTTDAFSPNPIKASVGDTVTWTNDDSTIHTVTSGSSGTPDNKFDSSNGGKTYLAPKQTFSHTFDAAGDYPYYCTVHPNMIGTVTVAAGSGGDGGTSGPMEAKVTAKTADGQSFDVTSKSTTSKATAVTIQEKKSVTVTFDKAGDVELTLPKDLISGITSITAGGNPVTFQPPTENANSTTVKFTVPAGSTSVVIAGTTVVPEFSVIAVAVLGISIAAIIGYTRFARNSGIGFFGRA